MTDIDPRDAQILHLQEEQARLKAQAVEISVALSDAGAGPCTLVEGVRELEKRAEAAESTLTSLIEGGYVQHKAECAKMPMTRYHNGTRIPTLFDAEAACSCGLADHLSATGKGT